MAEESIPITPDEYASLLGVQGSLDDWRAKWYFRSDDLEHKERINIANELVAAAFGKIFNPVLSQSASYREKLNVFVEELASKYLPTLIEVSRLHARQRPEKGLHAFTEGACLLWLPQYLSPAFLRFVREHPGSKELVMDILSNLHRSLAPPQKLQESLDTQGVLPKLSHQLDLIFVLLAYAPDVFSYARVHPSTVPLLDELIVALEAVPTSSPWKKKSHIVSHQVSTLSRALTSRDVRQLRIFVASDFEGARPFVAECELSTTNECIVLPEGMMLCSKCKAAQYCSREHQKKDWLNHKKMCFKPNW